MLGNFFSVTLLPVVLELPRESFRIGFGNPAIAARITPLCSGPNYMSARSGLQFAAFHEIELVTVARKKLS